MLYNLELIGVILLTAREDKNMYKIRWHRILGIRCLYEASSGDLWLSAAPPRNREGDIILIWASF